MKKLIICICMVITLLLAGCDSQNETNEEMAEGYLVEISDTTTFDCGDYLHYRIVYAKDTKVKYLIITGYHIYGITPLYNADGTLQIYEE